MSPKRVLVDVVRPGGLVPWEIEQQHKILSRISALGLAIAFVARQGGMKLEKEAGSEISPVLDRRDLPGGDFVRISEKLCSRTDKGILTERHRQQKVNWCQM